MSKQLKLAIGLAITATLVACGSTGNKSLKYESEDTISTKIIEGKTTKKEIQNIFGAPLVSSFDAGLLVWKYELEETSLDAISIPSILFTYGLAGTRSSGTKKQLTILFTDEGTVKKVNMSESPVTSGTMLFK